MSWILGFVVQFDQKVHIIECRGILSLDQVSSYFLVMKQRDKLQIHNFLARSALESFKIDLIRMIQSHRDSNNPTSLTLSNLYFVYDYLFVTCSSGPFLGWNKLMKVQCKQFSYRLIKTSCSSLIDVLLLCIHILNFDAQHHLIICNCVRLSPILVSCITTADFFHALLKFWILVCVPKASWNTKTRNRENLSKCWISNTW